MVGRLLEFRNMPRIPGLTPAQEADRARAFRRIDAKLRGRDLPLFSLVSEGLNNTEGRCKLHIADAMERAKRAVIKREDHKKSQELLEFLQSAVTSLKEPILSKNSANLADIYEDFVKGVSRIIDEGFFGRPHHENVERFLQVEPHMTTCCVVCDVSPLGEKVRGVLAASFISPQPVSALPGIIADEKPREAEIIHLNSFRGKYLKEGTEKGNSMVDDADIAGDPVKTAKPGKGIFSSIQTPEGGGWFAVMSVEDSLNRLVSEDDRNLVVKAKKLVSESKLSDTKKKALFEYLTLAETESGGRWSLFQADAVVRGYLGVKVPEENFNFEFRLMEAWCSNRVDEFLATEKNNLSKLVSGEEREKLIHMVDLALTRSRNMKITAAGTLRVFYPMQEPEKRIHMLESITYGLECAKPAKKEE